MIISLDQEIVYGLPIIWTMVTSRAQTLNSHLFRLTAIALKLLIAFLD